MWISLIVLRIDFFVLAHFVVFLFEKTQKLLVTIVYFGDSFFEALRLNILATAASFYLIVVEGVNEKKETGLGEDFTHISPINSCRNVDGSQSLLQISN